MQQKQTLKVLIENFEKNQKVLIWEGLKFPVSLIDINKFQNHHSPMSVNVFCYENLVYPPRISEHNCKRETTVSLLLTSYDTQQHYCWMKDRSKRLSFQTSRHGHVRHLCFGCLNTLNSEESLASHHEYCKSHEDIEIEFSE